MVNYANGKIYKLVSFQTDKVYIGSTCEKLSARIAKHKAKYRSFLNGQKCYITAFEIIKFDDVDIVLLEESPCVSKEQLHKRERHHIENTDNCVNKSIPTRSKKEWTNDNKDKIKEYLQEWAKDNKNKLNEYRKAYYEQNTDKIKEYKKEYYEKNIDKILVQKKEYNEKNIDRIKDYQKISYTCSCGSEVKKCKKSRHDKTKKHLNSLK
jgi:hypothetical protein